MQWRKRWVLLAKHLQKSMSQINITDLEVFYHVGVPEAERSKPQRLLITINLHSDFAAAAAGDDLNKTIDYFQVTQRILNFGKNREWKLIEKLAHDLADVVLKEFRPDAVDVTVKKFIIPQANHVSVSLTKKRL